MRGIASFHSGLGSYAIVVTALCALALASGCGQVDNDHAIESHKRLAAELQNNSLPDAAIVEYMKVLDYAQLSDEKRANICYLIGRLYFEGVKDYESAAAYFIRAREYDPNGSFVAEASKNLVASLEKLGNVLDARRQLAASADLDHQPADDNDVVVARVGDRDIYLSEVEAQIAMLPSATQAQLTHREAKLEYIHQYVGVELLHNAAIREDYLSEPQFQRERDELVKRLLVDRFVSDKIVPGVKIDSVDVRNHYNAYRDSLYDGRPFDSVRSLVLRDYQTSKAEAAYGDYISGLAKAERVEFFDHIVR